MATLIQLQKQVAELTAKLEKMVNANDETGLIVKKVPSQNEKYPNGMHIITDVMFSSGKSFKYSVGLEDAKMLAEFKKQVATL